jgi:hypothetical protein
MNITYCVQCTKMIYCSESCRQASWSKHHSIECQHYKLLNDLGLTHMEHLALRIILKKGLKKILGLKNYLISFENQCPNEDFKADKIYKSDDYLNIFRLVTHANGRDSEDLLRRSFIAAFFVKILIKSDFFQIIEGNADDYVLIGGLLLRHMQSISCNAHEINDFETSCKVSLVDCETRGIGAGIYGLLSMFNHSCDPCVTRNFDGIHCVVRALKPIPANQQIYDNYGHLYPVSDFQHRQSKLFDQYFFHCACHACIFKWPLYDQISTELQVMKFFCERCKLEITLNNVNSASSCCTKNKHLQVLGDFRLEFEKLRESSLSALHRFFNETEFSDAKAIVFSEKFISYLKFIDKHIVDRPFRDYNNFQEALKQCFNLLSKNKS